jgi:hypothetical protein
MAAREVLFYAGRSFLALAALLLNRALKKSALHISCDVHGTSNHKEYCFKGTQADKTGTVRWPSRKIDMAPPEREILEEEHRLIGTQALLFSPSRRQSSSHRPEGEKQGGQGGDER